MCVRARSYARPVQTVDLSQAAVVPAGASSFNLVLAPNVLAVNTVYTFQLTVTTTNPVGTGTGQVTFQTNTVRRVRAPPAASPRAWRTA